MKNDLDVIITRVETDLQANPRKGLKWILLYRGLLKIIIADPDQAARMELLEKSCFLSPVIVASCVYFKACIVLTIGTC